MKIQVLVLLAVFSLVITAQGCRDGGGDGDGDADGDSDGDSDGDADGDGDGDSCDDCRDDQVCVDGVCTDVPSECPCPLETYCDLATNTCVVGCIADENCSSGRICIEEERRCFTGCLEDGDCGDSEICEEESCVVGCRNSNQCEGDMVCIDNQCLNGCVTVDDCDAIGMECVDNLCRCPGEQVVCDDRCVALGTPENCGGCGDVCEAPRECVDGECQCELGACEPGAVVEDGDILRISKLEVVDGYLYYTVGGEIHRVPVTGGTPELVADAGALGAANIDEFAVRGDRIFMTLRIDYDSELYGVTMPATTPTLLDNAGDLSLFGSTSLALTTTQVAWTTRDNDYSGQVRILNIDGSGSPEVVTRSSMVTANSADFFYCTEQYSYFNPLIRHDDEFEYVDCPGEDVFYADEVAIYARSGTGVSRIAISDGSETALGELPTSEELPIRWLRGSDDAVFVAAWDWSGSAVNAYSIPTSGGDATLIAEAVGAYFAVDDRFIYYVPTEAGSVMRQLR